MVLLRTGSACRGVRMCTPSEAPEMDPVTVQRHSCLRVSILGLNLRLRPSSKNVSELSHGEMFTLISQFNSIVLSACMRKRTRSFAPLCWLCRTCTRWLRLWIQPDERPVQVAAAVDMHSAWAKLKCELGGESDAQSEALRRRSAVGTKSCAQSSAGCEARLRRRMYMSPPRYQKVRTV